ncbi:porin [Hydrogenophaga palleronii]|uniref:porin n=1 Tax=Hydrogenophaga palleronii TaxID=65655 RepID=UPI000A06A9E3|nr:porin [Hydrogenophaga palleronii]
MKKSLIALAVLGSVAGVAQAQSSVTLYGLIDASVSSSSQTIGGVKQKSVTRLDSGNLNTSRWGLTGSEDLGGGLKAIFRLEQGFDASNGTAGAGTAFARQSYVGLSGGFGTVTVGNVWTAMDDVLGATNSGFDSRFSSSNNVSAVKALYASNPGNTLKYVSPSFGGFSFAGTYSLDEVAAVKTDIADFSASYNGGPLLVNFAYQVQNDFAAPNDLKITHLGGAYDFGAVKLLASVGQVKLSTGKATDAQVGVDVPLSSAVTLSGGVSRSKDNAAAGNAKRTGAGVAVTYALSKRTTTYAGLNASSEKNAAGVKTEKDRIFAVGMQHTF